MKKKNLWKAFAINVKTILGAVFGRQGSHLSENKYTDKMKKNGQSWKNPANEEHWAFYSWPRSLDSAGRKTKHGQ
jgi:hypothetical protein